MLRKFHFGCNYHMFTGLHVGGLVHRTGTGTSSSGGGEDSGASGRGSSASAEKDLDRPDRDEGYEHGEDSKAVRLTLMEEVLLLGIKDREVCVL